MDQNLSLAKTYLDMLEGWKKGKSKRESWVPEAIADEDVADFMGAAAAAAKAGKKEFKFGDKTYKVTMKKSTVDAINDEANLCEKCGKVHEGSCNEEVQEASIQLVAKDLEAYAKKSGGIDKKDFMKAADMMKSNQKAALVKFVDNLDTEPRDKIISMVAQMMGRKTAEKMFSVKIREENEELDENNSDKYMWKDINAALMKAGMNPPQIMKVLSGLKGKAIKEEALDEVTKDTDVLEPRAKGEKDFKKMNDDNVEINDEEKNDDENFKNIKKSADAIEK